ncbi:PREDICTED: probable aspartyl protease At4g16563 [Nelumbo nucifera]|uniref:Peptidase A1 domain-containing protein n=2 Tax=Nelumbo nucifera TaxID=4432 RepID=A0A822XLW2_NELNU|nr:PREDICTED: probable aspartyl protease At4g16563 [Nelumbo nucifera]DAD18518.1 TPA_asm: hypothetical protein HUJ06_019981 [Nelumbo nucifera]
MASFISLLFFAIAIEHLSLSSSQIVLPLTHSLSETEFNHTHNLLKAASVRSTTRFRHHHRHHQNQRQISLPLSPGSDYTLSFSLGSNPTQTISLYMDTGSDLVWFPCAPFECILCEDKYDTTVTADATPPNVSSASRVSCNSPACSAVHSSLPSSDLCAIARCPLETIETSDCSSFSCPPFYYAYGDGSLIARLYRDSFSIPYSSPSLHLPNFTFGCAHTALAEPIGVAGFGQGILSLPAQLAHVSPQLGSQFSYCLISHSFDVNRIRRPSPLILGRYQKEKRSGNEGGDGEFLYTPMLDNPKHPYFYCVGLEAVSVGSTRIPASQSLKRVNREGNGGMVVDSGTTFTMLPAGLYKTMVAEFDHRVGQVYERATVVEDQTGLGPCYYYDDSVDKFPKVPKLVFHFVGNASVVLPSRNYFFGLTNGGDGGGKKRKAGCLMVMNGGDDAESGGPAATLGNYQQQGFEVVYDLEKRRVGFARKQCASLWQTLNRG